MRDQLTSYSSTMSCWSEKVWRPIWTKRKLLSIIGLAYVILTLAVYNNRFWTLVTSEVSFRQYMSNLAIGNFFNNRDNNTSNIAQNDPVITGFYDNLIVDIHIEDDLLGHTGEVADEYSGTSPHLTNRDLHNGTVIAIGVAITSKGTAEINEQNIANVLQLFTTFLPSFCSTVSSGYNFQFYFAYDKTDPVFTNSSLLQAFQKAFIAFLANQCPKNMEAGIHFVQCSHSGKPTWAQNDAMLEAYLDNVDYFYRINDDTKLQTKGWVEEFIKTLKGYDPPNVGVVGPTHSGGNTAILTYDFVHRTHVDIFGFYYPKLFTDWWGDDWITYVYHPGRSTKLGQVRLAHTMKLGQRYRTDYSVGNRLQARLVVDKKTLNSYLDQKKSTNATTKPDGKRVIAMTLYGKNPKDTWGAIRNAQLMPIVFPQWNLRFYVPHPKFLPPNANTTQWETVPRRILSKLRQLDAEIVYIRAVTDRIPPKYWRYLVAMDEKIDYFLIRDVDSRISNRDSAAVNDWMQETDAPALHCIRDHPKHAKSPMVDGLWGGRTSKLRHHLNRRKLYDIVKEFYSNISRELIDSGSYGNASYNSTDEHEKSSSADILNDILWPILSENALCHDSVSCDNWPNTHSFPIKRDGEEYLGQKFDERQESTSDDVGEIKSSKPLCNGKGLYPTNNSSMKT